MIIEAFRTFTEYLLTLAILMFSLIFLESIFIVLSGHSLFGDHLVTAVASFFVFALALFALGELLNKFR